MVENMLRSSSPPLNSAVSTAPYRPSALLLATTKQGLPPKYTSPTGYSSASSSVVSPGASTRVRKSADHVDTRPARFSWVLLQEDTRGRLKVFDKPLRDLCAQCELTLRTAYDGTCQSAERVKQERQWQKQVQTEVDNFRRLYTGKVAMPEAVERLQSQVDSLCDAIDVLLNDKVKGPVMEMMPAMPSRQAMRHELQKEREQNRLLEVALQELQSTMQEEVDCLTQENNSLRAEVESLKLTKLFSASPVSNNSGSPVQDAADLELLVAQLRGELERMRNFEGAPRLHEGWQAALDAERAASAALRAHIQSMESALGVPHSDQGWRAAMEAEREAAAALRGHIKTLEASLERDTVKLEAIERQLLKVTLERDTLKDKVLTLELELSKAMLERDVAVSQVKSQNSSPNQKPRPAIVDTARADYSPDLQAYGMPRKGGMMSPKSRVLVVLDPPSLQSTVAMSRPGTGDEQGQGFKPDLEAETQMAGVSFAEVRAQHASSQYTSYGMGASPPMSDGGSSAECNRFNTGVGDWICSAMFSPDSRYVATGGSDGLVHVREVATRQRFADCVGHDESVTSIAFSADGQLIASGGAGGLMVIFSVQTHDAIRYAENHHDTICGVAFSPDGSWVASGDSGGDIWLTAVGSADSHRLTRGNPLQREHTFCNPDSMSALVFSPNGEILASGGAHGVILLWDIVTRRQVGSLQGHTDWINCLAFSPDGAWLLSGSSNGVIRLWDMTSLTMARQFIASRQGIGIEALAFAPDGLTFVTGDTYGRIRIWQRENEKPIHRYKGHGNAVCAITYSPDGQEVISLSTAQWGSNDNLLRIPVTNGDVISLENETASGSITRESSRSELSLSSNNLQEHIVVVGPLRSKLHHALR